MHEAALPRPAGASPAQAPSHDDAAAHRLELILQQVDSLPTLPAIALRLLQMTNDHEAAARDAASLVASDPALAARVLKLVRCSERGRALNVASVERAALLLGFDALRSAVLSLQIFEVFENRAPQQVRDRSAACAFDRILFWRHSIAAAILCERLAGSAPALRSLNRAEAFTAGLLHDLGALVLHVLLPETLDRVCLLAESRALSLDQACRSIIGIDAHTAGRRLAECWRLPHALTDVIWLGGQRLSTLPDLPHRPMIALTTLADAIVRRAGLGFPGHGPHLDDVPAMCAHLGLPLSSLNAASDTLYEAVDERCAALGLAQPENVNLLLQATCRANHAIGRLNADLHQRAAAAQDQADTLKAITHFHETASPGGNVFTTMGKVVESAASLLGGSFFAMLYQPRAGEPWKVAHFDRTGNMRRAEALQPPIGSNALADLADTMQMSSGVLTMMPWLREHLDDAGDVSRLHLLPLHCGWGVQAALLHDCEEVDGREHRERLEAISRTWASAIAAGAQHDGAKRLGERLAESNRALMETQAELARSQALATLGEVAAGAAHEMNNPLCIISGRSQLLASVLTDDRTRAMAQQIVEQSHRLSDMITALRRFAEPLCLVRQPADLRALLDASIQALLRSRGPASVVPAMKVVAPPELPCAMVDAVTLGQAIVELLRNAAESEGCSEIECTIEIDPWDDRLNLRIADDGSGLTPHVLAHAFDPFFSVKPAGRQPGLGLAHARRAVEAHGGEIALANRSGRGAVATIRLHDWRAAEPAGAQSREGMAVRKAA